MIDLLNIKPTAISRDLSSYTTVLYGPPKIGKAQPNDTMIPTPNGYKKLGDLKVGDYVFDRKGNPTKITGVFPQGELEVFEVELNDGRKTLCNDEHIWTTFTSRGNFKDRTLREMIDSGLKETSEHETCKFAIPTHEAVKFEEKEYSIDPYVIGAFLGDGCCKETCLTFSSENEEIPNIIKEKTGFFFKKSSEKNYNWNFYLDEDSINLGTHTGCKNRSRPHTEEFFENFKNEICVGAADKRIPDVYKYGSVDQRLALLQGLMDTDGSISSKDYAVSFTSVSLNLIKDIEEVLHSLGYSNTTILTDRRSKKYKNGVCYKLIINISNEEKIKLFRLTRKINIAKEASLHKKRKNYNQTKIKNAKSLNYKTEMTCIMVDNPEHLYLTNDYIVTHNTSFARDAGALILSTEKGYGAIAGAMIVDIKTFADMKIAVSQLKKKEVKDKYKLIAIDTIDILATLCEKYVCSANDIESLGELPYGQGWTIFKKELENIVRGITSEGYGLLALTHEKEVTIKPQDGEEYVIIKPSLSESVWKIFANAADTIVYAHTSPKTKERILQIRTDDNSVICGSRFKYIQSIVPFTYNDFMKAMNNAIDEEEKNGGTITDEKPFLIEDDLPNYEELMEKGNTIVRKLLSNDPSMISKVNGIVEEVLGVGKKFSECSPRQTEAMSVIVNRLETLVDI